MLAKAKLAPLVEIERKRSFKRRLKIIFLAVFLLAFLAGIIYAVFFSDFFAVRAVEVYGNESADSEEIMKIAEEAAICGKWLYRLAGSNNIIFWRDAEIVNLPHGFPQIASVKINRNLKEREIVIEVIERDKFVVWCEGNCFWIDEAGVAFAEAPETEGPLIKMVNVNSARSLALGERPLIEKEAQTFAQIVRFLDSLNLAVNDIKIDDMSFKEMNVKILNGPKVLFSLIIDPVFGKPVIESLKENGLWGKIDYLDLRVDGRAYYKLK